MKYVALLRGVNVGGNSLIKMVDLRTAMETAGFKDVSTYILSGNVLFSSDERDQIKLAKSAKDVIKKNFKLNIKVVVFSSSQVETIVKSMPKGWGSNPEWKYNTLFLIPPYSVDDIMAEIGELKPGIEVLEKGDGVLYQSAEFKACGRSRTGKLASMRCYQQMTARNYNTTVKLTELLRA